MISIFVMALVVLALIVLGIYRQGIVHRLEGTIIQNAGYKMLSAVVINAVFLLLLYVIGGMALVWFIVAAAVLCEGVVWASIIIHIRRLQSTGGAVWKR